MDHHGFVAGCRYLHEPPGLHRASYPTHRRALVATDSPTVERIITDGDSVVVLWNGHAVAKDGQAYDNRYCWILRVMDQTVKEAVAFFDSATLTDLLERVSP